MIRKIKTLAIFMVTLLFFSCEYMEGEGYDSWDVVSANYLSYAIIPSFSNEPVGLVEYDLDKNYIGVSRNTINNGLLGDKTLIDSYFIEMYPPYYVKFSKGHNVLSEVWQDKWNSEIFDYKTIITAQPDFPIGGELAKVYVYTKDKDDLVATYSLRL